MNKINNQFSFFFGNKFTYKDEDFIVTSSNEDAHKFINSWPDWGNHRLSNVTYLEGSKGSGKTHLATIWQKISHARFLFKADFIKDDLYELIDSRQSFIIDNFDNNFEFENKLLHIINLIIESKKYLLITSSVPLLENDIKLPDLRSRINGINHIKIKDPDDILLEGMLLKLLSDRQLRVSKEVLQFILSKTTRSYEAINDFIEQIDQKSLEQKRNITVPFLNQIEIANSN